MMGDSPYITLLSALPLFVILFSIWMALLAWRTKKRAVRRIVALLMIVMGVLIIFTRYGMFFSLGAGILIAMLGIILFFISRSSDGDVGK
jgi:drug/metabolite transporter (DMT)-like permease